MGHQQRLEHTRTSLSAQIGESVTQTPVCVSALKGTQMMTAAFRVQLLFNVFLSKRLVCVMTIGAVVGSLFNNLLQMHNVNLPYTLDLCLFLGVICACSRK